MNAHTKKEIDYNYIADGIYIGTNQCCQTHFDQMLLQKEGIDADVSLERERVDAPFGVDFYVWIPVADQTAPTQEQLDFGLWVLEKLVQMKKKIYVHCKNGHGRAPTLVAAYLVKQGKSVDEAIAFIQSKRPPIHIEKAQREALGRFKKRVFLYQCEECGFLYSKEEIAQKCQAWRKEHKSCNLEIIKHAIKDKGAT